MSGRTTDTFFFSSYSTKFLDASRPHNPTPTNMTSVEWDAWGPANTRWFQECLPTDWQHALHGMRTAESISIKVYEGMSKATMETLEEMAEDPDDNVVRTVEEDVLDESEVVEVNDHEDSIDAKCHGADIEVLLLSSAPTGSHELESRLKASSDSQDMPMLGPRRALMSYSGFSGRWRLLGPAECQPAEARRPAFSAGKLPPTFEYVVNHRETPPRRI